MTYGQDDRPSWCLSAFLGVQHLLLALMYLFYPLLLIQEAGYSVEASRSMLMATLGVTGVMTFLQAHPGRRVGSGFLAIQTANPIFLPLSLEAVRLGGLGLLAGLMAMTGVVQIVVAHVFYRLRSVFSAEVCGVVIMMLGISLVGAAATRCTGYGLAGAVVPHHLAIAGITLGLIIGVTVWAKGSLRLFAVGIGIAAGYLASWALGVVTPESFASLSHTPMLAFPLFELPDYRFSLSLLIPFLITGIVASLDVAGGLILCQKMNDRNWVRPDLGNLRRGILTDGLANLAGGLSGAFGIGVSSSNIGLAMATGAAARRIAYVTSAFLLILMFFPRVTDALILIPLPVMGAVLVYISAFLMVFGAHIAMSRMLDDRRTAMIGVALVAGLIVEIQPDLFRSAPAFWRPLLSSSLALTAVTAIALNLLFRLGTKKTLEWVYRSESHTNEDIFAFMEKCGGAWGARHEVIQKASSALAESVECLQASEPLDTLVVTASYTWSALGRVATAWCWVRKRLRRNPTRSPRFPNCWRCLNSRAPS
jgi:xanthine permease XanP